MTPAWIKTTDRKPDCKGVYIVCFANPYEANMGLGAAYFEGEYFTNETAGANYIAFWLDGIDLPELSREERHKLVSSTPPQIPSLH